jgi:Cu-Zn family superoxide dismutase
MQIHLCRAIVAFGVLVLAAPAAIADDLQVQMQLATPTGPGQTIGTVTINGGPNGAEFKTDLRGLPPGQHGFHVHEHNSCASSTGADSHATPAGGAGGHWDPNHTGRHLGPTGEGHLGDLPALTVDPSGAAQETLLAPRIKDIQALKGHALMIHAGGDNYSDQPKPLGGGGARIACGVIE